MKKLFILFFSFVILFSFANIAKAILGVIIDQIYHETSISRTTDNNFPAERTIRQYFTLNNTIPDLSTFSIYVGMSTATSSLQSLAIHASSTDNLVLNLEYKAVDGVDNITGYDYKLTPLSSGSLNAGDYYLRIKVVNYDTPPLGSKTVTMEASAETPPSGLGSLAFAGGGTYIPIPNTWLYFRLIGNEQDEKITMTNPPQFQTTIIDSEIPLDDMAMTFEGWCNTNGSDRIYLHFEPESYIPDASDFNAQSVDCTSNAWEATISGFTTSTNVFITAWARDWYDTSSSTPAVLGQDYVTAELYVYYLDDFWSWDPEQQDDDTFSLKGWIFEKLNQLSEFFKSKIPLVYFFDVWEVWQNTDYTLDSTDTEIVFDFSFGGDFPEYSGLELYVIDLEDPYALLDQYPQATQDYITGAIDQIEDIWIPFFALIFFVNWIIGSYKKWVIH